MRVEDKAAYLEATIRAINKAADYYDLETVHIIRSITTDCIKKLEDK